MQVLWSCEKCFKNLNLSMIYLIPILFSLFLFLLIFKSMSFDNLPYTNHEYYVIREAKDPDICSYTSHLQRLVNLHVVSIN